MKQKITTKELVEVLLKFDNELELDEEKLAELSDKEKGELFLAVKRVLKYREDFPADLADAVQHLAKQAIEKQQGTQKGVALDLDPDEDGVVCNDGEIIEPGDELFPLAKKMLLMSEEQITDWLDNITQATVKCCTEGALLLLKKRVCQIEKQRTVKKDDDKAKGDWPTVTQQM